MKYFLLISFIVCSSFHSNPITQSDANEFGWADRMLARMSLDEMIGQLFMIRAHSNLGADHVSEVKRQIKEYKIGGLCFFQGTPVKQAELTNEYQKLSEIPLLVSMDAEWGLGFRFKADAISFPKALTLGAIKHNDVIYEMGKEIADHLTRIGVHVNFAPVVDVNNNADNPVIHNRSFGEDKYNVAAKGYAYMKGMQDSGIIACAKHFPGHGDTDSDSHYSLPVINHTLDRIDSIELAPFKNLSQLGVKSIMTAHLQVSALDARVNRPTSLSERVIQGVLIDKMGYNGLIFTDALEMEGVAKHYKAGEIEVEALKAGNDVLLLPINIDAAFKKIKEAVKTGSLDSVQIRNKARKVLIAKEDIGLTSTPTITSISGIPRAVNTNKSLALKSKLFQEAITLVNNEDQILPITYPFTKKIGVLSLGVTKETPFQERIKSYANVNIAFAADQISQAKISSIKKDMADKDLVIVSLHDMNIYSSKKYGLSEDQLDLIFTLNSQGKILLVNFGTPYALRYFPSIKNIVQSYEEDDICQDVTAQMIFGAYGFEGLLPVSACDRFPYRTGLITNELNILKYGLPEQVGMSSDSLDAIEGIVAEMIEEEAAPGCQVFAIKDGQIVYEKAFGYHTYEKKKKVEMDDVYDVASVTKVLATTISMMKLEESGLVNLSQPIDRYLPEIDTCDKGDIFIEDAMAHVGKLPGWIPFYKNTLDEKSEKGKPLLSPKYYRKTESDSFNIKIAEDIYLRFDYRDSIYQRIYTCGLRDTDDYRYSDLGFYIFDKIISRVSNTPLDEFCETHFYHPLGLTETCFNPTKKISLDRIVPSEDDDYFRNGKVQGYVHDMGAAMLGGVAGHAGLFSTAKELGILMQMLLNGGSFGGKTYLDPYTIRKYTTRHYKSSRRGLGFDMKETNPDKTINMSERASNSTFGHLGFTGTAVFADPEYNLVYIFLSNRTYPTMDNKKFSQHEYRPRIQSVLYSALKS